MNQLQTQPLSQEPTQLQQKSNQYLTFVLGQETYALQITGIKEIIEYGSLTQVPMMPDFIRGVINLRGRVVPAVDLQARFDLPVRAPDKRTCIVIAETTHEGSGHEVGVVVDAVSAVLEIDDSDVEPAPTFGARIRADFIQGMGRVNDEFVIILDVSRVLSVDEMALLSGSADMVAPETATEH